jgi:hypothetical protein
MKVLHFDMPYFTCCFVQRPDDGLITPKHVAKPVKQSVSCVSIDDLPFFTYKFITQRDVYCSVKCQDVFIWNFVHANKRNFLLGLEGCCQFPNTVSEFL